MVPAVSFQPELPPEMHASRPFRMFRRDFDGIQILSLSFDPASYSRHGCSEQLSAASHSGAWFGSPQGEPHLIQRMSPSYAADCASRIANDHLVLPPVSGPLLQAR